MRLSRREFLGLAAGVAAGVAAAQLLRSAGSGSTRVLGRARVVVVGGGIGGAHVASLLASRGAQVLVVEPNSAAMPGPAKIDVLLGASSLSDWLVYRKHGSILRAYVTGVDPWNRVVKTTAGLVEYDYLVLAPGLRLAYEELTVAEPFTNYTPYDDWATVALAGLADRVTRGTVVIAHPDLPFKCTSGPYETAFMLSWMLRQRGVRDRVRIVVVSGTREELPPEWARQVSTEYGEIVYEEMLREGIEYVGPGEEVVEVWGDRVVTRRGEVIKYDYLSLLPPNRGWPWLIEAGLSSEADLGFVRVDERMRSTRFDDVYAVGDVTHILTKTGMAAVSEAEVVAASILSDMGEPVDVPRTLRSMDAIRVSPSEAVYAYKEWLAPDGEKVRREVRSRSRSGFLEKVSWMRAMKKVLESINEYPTALRIRLRA